MKAILLKYFLFLSALSCNAQIDSLVSFKHTISFLHGHFKLDKFNSKCANCYDCRKELIKDSLIRADTTSYKWYTGSRVLGNCIALQQLQILLKLDSTLQAKVAFIGHMYMYDSLYNKFINLNKSWYSGLDNTIQFHISQCDKVQGGFFIEHIAIATIMVKSRLEELIAINKLVRYE